MICVNLHHSTLIPTYSQQTCKKNFEISLFIFFSLLSPVEKSSPEVFIFNQNFSKHCQKICIFVILCKSISLQWLLITVAWFMSRFLKFVVCSLANHLPISSQISVFTLCEYMWINICPYILHVGHRRVTYKCTKAAWLRTLLMLCGCGDFYGFSPMCSWLTAVWVDESAQFSSQSLYMCQ